MIQKLKAIPSLKNVDLDTLEKMSLNLSFSSVKRNTVLFEAGQAADCCFLVSYGAVKLINHGPNDKDSIFKFCKAGDILGAAVMTQKLPEYPITAIALEDSGLIKIPQETFNIYWQEVDAVKQMIRATMLSRIMELQEDKALVSSSITYKLAHFLLKSLDEQETGDLTTTINIKLTRKDIADKLGARVETVIRVFSRWTQDKIISTTNQRITVENRKALEEFLDEKSP